MQMGRFAAGVILAELEGATSARAQGFQYRDLGSMATIGKSRAVVEIGGWRFGGLLAWLAWLGLHITVLIGFRNRLAVLSSWVYSYVLFRRGVRLITDAKPERIRRLAPAGMSLSEDNTTRTVAQAPS
jgi:NADH dehydrogenase